MSDSKVVGFPLKFSKIDEIQRRLEDLMAEYTGEIPVAVAVGCLEVVKANIIARTLE